VYSITCTTDTPVTSSLLESDPRDLGKFDDIVVEQRKDHKISMTIDYLEGSTLSTTESLARTSPFNDSRKGYTILY